MSDAERAELLETLWTALGWVRTLLVALVLGAFSLGAWSASLQAQVNRLEREVVRIDSTGTQASDRTKDEINARLAEISERLARIEERLSK